MTVNIITIYYKDENNSHQWEDIYAFDGYVENMNIFTKKGRKELSRYVEKNAKENNILITRIDFCMTKRKYTPIPPELIYEAIK